MNDIKEISCPKYETMLKVFRVYVVISKTEIISK